jgi:hypothetical protein
MDDQLPVTPASDTEEPLDFSYRVAVFFLAGHYAAEQVRKRQQYAHNRGHNLSKEDISRIFREEAEYMVEKINRTSGE